MQNSHVNDDNKEIKSYLKELTDKKYRPIPISVERALVKAAQNGDKQSEKQIIEAHLRLVVNISKRYKGRGVEITDLIQEGNLGLYEALRRFDLSKDIRFCAYAEWWVKNYINKALSKNVLNSNEVSMSSLILEENADDEKEGDILFQNNKNSNPFLTEDFNEQQEEEISQTVQFLLKSLDERMKYVIERCYGLNGHKIMTMVEIAKELNLTPERVRQIKIRAMMNLRSNALMNSISMANLLD